MDGFYSFEDVVIIPAPDRAYFLFQAIRHPRHLHSFPTRRSSDLVTNRQAGVPAVASAATEPVALVVTRWFDPDVFGDPDRSEEHTSELQSHHDLVCRLLLEKKKPPSCATTLIVKATAYNLTTQLG